MTRDSWSDLLERVAVSFGYKYLYTDYSIAIHGYEVVLLGDGDERVRIRIGEETLINSYLSDQLELTLRRLALEAERST